MADDPHNTSDISEHNEPTAPAKEDAETTAARRELKQTTISEKRGRDAVQLSQDDKSASEDDAPRSKTRRITPPADLRPNNDDALKEQVSSPKKKRAHDELDENKDVTPLGETPDKATAGAAAVQDRTDRSEPEKKRPRDRQASASAVQSGKEEVEPLSASTTPRSSMEQTEGRDSATVTTKPDQPKQTSATAFANSGFAKLAASSTSPFGSFAASGKPSLFGSSSGSSSLGGTQSAAPSSPPKLSFSGASTSSPFAGLNGQAGGSVFKSSPFASAFGGGSLSGPRLNFGKPGEALKSDKPVKPFGAPDSDVEEGSGEESDEDEDAKGDASSDDEGKKNEKDREDSKGAEDKKKPKLQKDSKAKHVRLIMRQDHTLRVILNTVVLPAMKFQVTNRLKASTVLFTAFEDGQARQVQMKMSEANAASFSQLVEMLKKRLAEV
ncbi:hypothetical protein VTH82DRAFT_4244 [Thermothelomyces myriococcoides]